MSVSIFFYGGKIYIPSTVVTNVGYLMVEPVTVLDANDITGLEATLRQKLLSEIPEMPTPSRDNFPKPFLHRYANVKSWRTFERNCLEWSLQKKKDLYVYQGMNKVPGGWDNASEKDVILGPATDLDTVLLNAVAHIQEFVQSAVE